jgi:predicted HAD superfamily Cof-like phosphohydrolase
MMIRLSLLEKHYSISSTKENQHLNRFGYKFSYIRVPKKSITFIQMNDSLVKVAQFHQTFDHPIGFNHEVDEALKIRQLRIKLLFEELAELAEAGDCRETFRKLCEEKSGHPDWPRDGDNVNKTEELDALCDIQYVLNGKILTSGLHHIFDKAFNVVHLNNMRKAHRSEAHCRETIAALGKRFEDFIITERVAKDGQYTVNGNVYILMNDGGKVIKPHDHMKVDLTIEKMLDPNFIV